MDLPDDFPESELVSYMTFARSVLLTPKSDSWTEFAGASNLIAWRYRGSYEGLQFYKDSLAAQDNPAHEELYKQQHALFVMFSSGVSCIESTVYSLAALASHPTLLGFPFKKDHQRDCKPTKLLEWIKPYEQSEAISVVLKQLIDAKEWELWVKLRNRMTHRSNLPRIVYASIGAPLPPSKPINFSETSSTPAIAYETTDFDALHDWLASTLTSLLIAGTSLNNAQTTNK